MVINMYSTRLRKISRLLLKANSFSFLYSFEDAELKYKTFRSAINSNDGLWKNPNIIHYLKGHDTGHDELSKAVKKHAKSNDIGCVVTSIPLSTEKFKSKWRAKEDVFIFDEHGVRMHFKVKNKYPENPYSVRNQYGEIYQKVQVTKVFDKLELIWERSPETQMKIDSAPNLDLGWFEENEEKIKLILEKLPENQFNQKLLADLKKKKKIDNAKLEKLYDEAIAQTRSSFNDVNEVRSQLGLNTINTKSKSKTTIKITHVGQKEVPSFRGVGTDVKSQIIGISDDFKEKVVVKFGLGTRASEQLAKALDLPKQGMEIKYIGFLIQNESSENKYVPCEIDSVGSQIKVKVNDHDLSSDAVKKQVESLSSGDTVTVMIKGSLGHFDFHEKHEPKIIKRVGNEFTFDNFIDVKVPSGYPQFEDIHKHTDKLIGKKVTVEGDFKLYNGVVFVSRPKFTKS